MNDLLQPRVWPSFSPSRKPGVLGCSFDRTCRRGVRLRLTRSPQVKSLRTSSPCNVPLGFASASVLDLSFGLPPFMRVPGFGFRILPFVLWFSRAFEQIFNPHFAIVDRVALSPRLARMAGRHAHLHGLATAIHKTSGLRVTFYLNFSTILLFDSDTCCSI